MSGNSPACRIATPLAAVALFVAGAAVGHRFLDLPLPRVAAATAVADEAFAACTAPIADGVEGLFLLDFETGDLTGGVLNRTTAKFTSGYRHNVLKDLDFKAGKVKNPRFLLTVGLADFVGNASTTMAGSVLYVTDVTTGVTAAYGIPLNAQQAASPLVPLDKARPRGGKVP